MENLKIIPYIKVDGIRTFTDSQILSLYDRMDRDGSRDIVFYDGHVNSPEKFLEFMRRPGVWAYILLLDGETIGFTWLDNILDRSCFHHYCLFKEVWGHGTADLGKTALARLINMNKDGVYKFDLFKGLIPAWNRLAIKFAITSGYKKLGVLPKAAWNAKRKESDDALMVYCTREDVE